MAKTFVGPQLRALRRDHRQTQAEMAARLGISPAYVNLLENNQRSLSVKLLMNLTETYGVDWRHLLREGDISRLAELRSAASDPLFSGPRPDLQQLRGALDHAPALVDQFLELHAAHRKMMDRFSQMQGLGELSQIVSVSPETAIHDVFRSHQNHFDSLERAATALRSDIGGPPDEMYPRLKDRLASRHGLGVEIASIDTLPETLRVFDRAAGRVVLSEALDHPNRIFQMAHVLGLLEADDALEALVAQSPIPTAAGQARLRVELANYFAAALLMPYEALFARAEATAYDVDRIAASFGVSFEQVCHRLTTLQRDGARGVAFFFLRIDKAGNVTKRFNATPFTLAEQGGACPVWNIHSAFRMPGVIVPQFVELPDGGQFFTISRTTERPVFNRQTQDRRLVVTLGCARSDMHRIGYTEPFQLDQPGRFDPIGIKCQICPRQACSQRAHVPLHITLPINADRRGNTRYES
jgi:predicted transcriptional regulator/transcriptional regulator with XRE-family HTH domain